MNSMINQAIAFATQAHESVNQRRKYNGEPYMVHPLAVMQLLKTKSSDPVSDAQLAAALAHDTVEDTPVTLEQVREELGDEVAQLVGWLTDVSTKDQGPRRVRKAIDRAHTAQAPREAKNIKLCDIIHNSEDIAAHDPNFARVWLREAQALLEVMQDADPSLLQLATLTVSGCLKDVHQQRSNK
jgi:(p)ppGpp synthase/HD superfamily hydrolase